MKTAFVLPSPFVLDLQEFFAEHMQGGVFIDAELCRSFAEGLGEHAQQVQALEAFARAHDVVERLGYVPRSAAQRQALARAATPLDPDGRVVLFPVAAMGPGLDGSAA